MRGIDVYHECRAELAKAGKPPSKLAPDVFLEVLNKSLRAINDKTNVRVCRNMTFTISDVTGRFVRIQVSGIYVDDFLGILRCSYQPIAVTGAEPVRIEPPFQDTGPEASGATVETGPPQHAWIEPDDGGTGVTPVSRQVWGFYPMPDQAYVINAVCKLMVPDYSIWTLELPVQLRAHSVVGDEVLARLFSMRDFHDNALKSYYYARAAEGVARLQRGDIRLTAEPATQDFNDTGWRLME